MTINEMINETLGNWTTDFLANRAEDIKRVDLLASRELLNSLDKDIQEATADDIAVAFLAFEPYGRFFDLKRLKKARGGTEYIKALEQWIKREGVEKFTSGFKKKRSLPKDESKLLNKLAWGIALSKKRRKRKAWYSKTREEDISELYTMLLNGYQQTVTENLKQSANGNQTR